MNNKKTRQIIHDEQKEISKETNIHVQQDRIFDVKPKGIDSGLHGKTAEMIVREFLDPGNTSPKISSGPNTPDITLKSGDKEFYVEVKTGSAILGIRNSHGEWIILKSADAVVYSPEIDLSSNVLTQFYVFTKDEFMQLWESLGLMRKKVSTSALRNFRIMHGNEKCDTETNADLITIQSFKNSAKKHALVLKRCKEMPVLSCGGKEKILKLMEMKSGVNSRDLRIKGIVDAAVALKIGSISLEEFIMKISLLVE